MERRNCLFDPAIDIVADASIVINLNATGCCEAILDALPSDIFVVDIVEQELEYGRAQGRTDADVLGRLKAGGRVEVVGLGRPAMDQFRMLVDGPASQTLDDGEAATIAFADENNAVALIDERKANRICTERFPGLARKASVDLLAHPAVQKALGAEPHRVAVFNALYYGKMRVLPHHQQWVRDLVGPDAASKCMSLPRSVRTG